MNYKIKELQALAAEKNFDVLRDVGRQGTVIWGQINQELEQIKNASAPAVHKTQELLLVSIASHQSYAVQELSSLIRRDNSDGKYNDILKSALTLAVLTNNANDCLDRICSCAKPERHLLEDSMAFAKEQGLAPQSEELSLQGHKAIDVLRRALNPEKVAELRAQVYADWKRKQPLGNSGSNTGFNTTDKQQREKSSVNLSPIYSLDADPDQIMERLKALTTETTGSYTKHDYRFQTWGHAIVAVNPHIESGDVFAEMNLHSAADLKNGDVLLTMSQGRQIASMVFDVQAVGNPADLYKCNVVKCAPHMGIGHNVNDGGTGSSLRHHQRLE